MIYRNAFRPLLFAQDPETAHERALELIAGADRLALPSLARPFTHARLITTVAGIEFPNPVGLAAGCDKNGVGVAVWPHFGFGFVEVGTVTAQAQPGNPRPRLFRLAAQGAIVNRLGFNGDGSEVVAKRLAELRRRRSLPVPLGINIGKTKLMTGDEATLEDYRTSFRKLAPFADYVTVNVSSPNTPGLRQWQERSHLTSLLTALNEESRSLPNGRNGVHVTIFVKISPDMAESDMEAVAEVALELQLAGVIATNTTLARDGLVDGANIEGGLSGKPLRVRSTEVVRFLYRRLKGRVPLIGVGGIFSAEDAYEKIRAGASLVQIYTGMIYEGPYLPRRINRGLLRLLERDGVAHVSDAVGVDV